MVMFSEIPNSSGDLHQEKLFSVTYPQNIIIKSRYRMGIRFVTRIHIGNIALHIKRKITIVLSSRAAIWLVATICGSTSLGFTVEVPDPHTGIWWPWDMPLPLRSCFNHVVKNRNQLPLGTAKKQPESQVSWLCRLPKYRLFFIPSITKTGSTAALLAKIMLICVYQGLLTWPDFSRRSAEFCVSSATIKSKSSQTRNAICMGPGQDSQSQPDAQVFGRDKMNNS